jgi:hypothetical protein
MHACLLAATVHVDAALRSCMVWGALQCLYWCRWMLALSNATQDMMPLWCLVCCRELAAYWMSSHGSVLPRGVHAASNHGSVSEPARALPCILASAAADVGVHVVVVQWITCMANPHLLWAGVWESGG